MNNNAPKIQTSTLTQQIVNFLKQRILDGELRSGERVWAAELAEEFGVSIAPVKEALLILQGEGLIKNVPRRGSVVRQFTPQDVEDLIYIRHLIEADAAANAIKQGNITPKLLASLTSHNEAIGSYRTEEGGFSDRIVPYEHDRQFHDIIVAACGKKLLAELYQRLNDQAQIIRVAIWNIGSRGDKTYEEHRAIIEAMAAADQKAVRKAVKYHLDSIFADFNRAVKSNQIVLSGQRNGALPHGRRNLKTKL